MRRWRSFLPFALLALSIGVAGPASAQVLSLDPPGLSNLKPPAAPKPATTTTRYAGAELVGVFAIQSGSCAGNVSGSYFRMVQPGGNTNSGPFVDNGDSPCDDSTYTPLRAGTDGGLATGGYQPNPNPAFDGAGHGLANKITQPQGFFSVRFATATNDTDPQTNTKTSVPRIYHEGGKLSGDLRAFAAAWNRQHFNQGSPKPDGTKPGNTAGPAGTYDAQTGAFTLHWSSLIVGGPFNNFTGIWHFVGTFRSGVRSAPPARSGDTTVGGTTTGAPATGSGSAGPRDPLAATGGNAATVAGLALFVLGSAPYLRRLVRRNVS